MEKMREDLKEITDQHEKFKFVEGTNTNEPKVTHIRETSSTLEAQIIGRSDEKGEILASLIDRMTEDITVLPIYGIGGIGKTTLAKMVYNSSHFKEYAQVWVYVSQKFDWKAIGNSIISQLAEKEERKHTEMQMIHNSLEKILDNKKILIVLDDLWEGDESRLEILMDMLRVGKGGNVVVLVTKRDEGIAKKISTIQPYKLAPLTDEMCWSIIRQKSAFESRGNKEQLEHIGKDIALKCAGVALAAKSLGHMLKSMKFREWESVRDSDIWNVSSLKDASSAHVLASLKLSYSVMPSYLKLCFAYCAIFPKGHKIVKDDLIHQWVSLGFSNWQFSEKYISQRLGLSFLEHSKSPSTIKLYDEDITLLTMHDLVHDLARSVMDDEILVSGKGDSIEGSCYHYALLDDCSKPLGMESSKIRALRFVHCDKIKIHDVLFSSNKSLRVLDLSECSMHKLPDSIGVLKQLRYLNAPRVQDATIPNSITWLSKLMYLSLRGSPAILALPKSIGEIEHLVYLDLSDCSRIEKLPESSGRLKELVHLIFQIALALELINRAEGTIDSLINYICSNLSNMEHLDLSQNNMRSIPESICNLRKLHTLNLAKCVHLKEIPGSIGTMDSLKFVDINGCWIISKAPQLGSSALSLPHFGVQPGDGHSSSNLVLLQYMDPMVLKLSKLENVKSVEEAQRINLTGKKILEDLKLEWTPNAERFVDHKILMENLVPPSTLKKLEICGYSGVSFPAWLVLDQLPNLEHLVLRGMANLEEWTTSHSNGERHVLAQLEINDCPMLRMKPLPPKARNWMISNSANVLSSWEEFTGPHTNATSSFCAVPTTLYVENCNVPLYQWRLLQHLPSLTCLHINGSVDLTGSPEVILTSLLSEDSKARRQRLGRTAKMAEREQLATQKATSVVLQKNGITAALVRRINLPQTTCPVSL
ncbi:hypothetical protein ACQ4PT_042310 [Festuca glaucescens]